jgi:hypothetical protein
MFCTSYQHFINILGMGVAAATFLLWQYLPIDTERTTEYISKQRHLFDTGSHDFRPHIAVAERPL